MPKFHGKRGEEVRQWLFPVATARRINGHAIHENNLILPEIASIALNAPASGWYQKWSLTTPEGEELEAILHNSNATIMIDMGELDQISNYCLGLKPRTRTTVKLENPSPLNCAMDLVVKFVNASFEDDDFQRNRPGHRFEKPLFNKKNRFSRHG
ncbi:TPA: hypothetical protein N0F65_010677 [Lagenidium giganteum]|uniref:Uncharacterized protein n=1 Tax=Lagenidium giganteum TaxID=4803 RepID=A0AAV2ZB98_9STRA|nr:TPA: hypothetical protein N0F65_010677 [Lagenidium giganteum]